MIYEIISKNTVPISQMHIYLKNKTGSDGDIYPEIFNDLSITESVNGLYAFATACVLTKNFTDTTNFLKDYQSKEVAVLSLIQYLKGMATTVQLNKECVSPLYENLRNINQLGTAPTLLNLDGDLFHTHYDKSKYFSKEAADEAEDSFPYWIIKTVKEITECTELVTPTSKTFELPYYIQNISTDLSVYIYSIFDGPNISGPVEIGELPPSGIEAVIGISDNKYILASSSNAFIYFSDIIKPIKHVVDETELDSDTGTLKLPEGEFNVICKDNTLTACSYGINNHYYSLDNFTYTDGDAVHILGLFRKNGIIKKGHHEVYMPLHSDTVIIKNNTEEHTKKAVINDDIDNCESEHSVPQVFSDCKYLVIIPANNEEMAHTVIINIIKKTPYKSAYIDVDCDGKYTVVVYGDNDSTNAIKVKKKILAVFGYKAIVIEFSMFYK